MRLAFGTFVLDLDQRRLFRGLDEIRLERKAFDLLRTLVEARTKALSKDELLARVWPDAFVTENNLATLVRDLRDALGDDAREPRFIRTVFGYGYAFAAEVTGDATGTPSGWRLIHAQREIRLFEGDNVLGRTGAGVVIVEGPTVSKQHARVRVAGGGALLEDLGSKNGTWVDDAPVTAAVPLRDGADLRLGSVRVRVRYAPPDQTTETAMRLP